MESLELKKIPETAYLNAENAGRYRTILRYFYTQHERMRHFLYAEDVYEAIRSLAVFDNYTFEQLQQDLEALVRWGNLWTRQDTGRMRTVEEFKKKRFLYQCSPYTVEIERMILRLEQLGDTYGGSLEKTRFERFYDILASLVKKRPKEVKQDELYREWEEVTDLFQKIWKNASDYTATLESDKLEDMLQSDEFLTYKETLIHYLRDFIVALQRSNMKIEEVMSRVSEEWVGELCQSIAEYEAAIPRMDGQDRPVADWEDLFRGQFVSMKEWFLGRDGEPGESYALQQLTTEAIRRITRMVQRLGERHHQFRSRKRDYLHLARWFEDCEDLEEAHQLSAMVFGLTHTRHLYASEHETENIYADIWDEVPTNLQLKPRIRQYRDKTKATAIVDQSKKKEEVRKQHLEETKEQWEVMNQLFVGGRLVISETTYMPVKARKILLVWVAKAIGNKEGMVRTEFGTEMKLTLDPKKNIQIESEDGVLTMPSVSLEIVEGKINGRGKNDQYRRGKIKRRCFPPT